MFGVLKRDPASVNAERVAQRGEDRPRTVLRPRVDIRETAAVIAVTVDLPGCDQQAVEVDVDRGVLSLRATPRDEAPAGLTPLWREYGDRVYERSFTLPDAIDASGVKAVMRDGVLTLTLPKAKEAQPRRIAVDAG